MPKVVGPNSGLPGTEAELDSQYLMAMGNSVPTTMWSTPGNAPTNPNNEPFLTWIKAINALSDPPQVLSVSYGDDEQSVGCVSPHVSPCPAAPSPLAATVSRTTRAAC